MNLIWNTLLGTNSEHWSHRAFLGLMLVSDALIEMPVTAVCVTD